MKCSHLAVRFLGLAAVLLSLGTPYDAAKALYLLLDDSSEKNQLLPTVQQLKDLFIVLQSKIGTSDFVNSLQGWDMILKSAEVGLRDHFIDPGEADDDFFFDAYYADVYGSDEEVLPFNERAETSAEPNSDMPRQTDTSETAPGLHRIRKCQDASRGNPRHHHKLVFFSPSPMLVLHPTHP